MAKSPKRYLVDAGLAAAAVRLDLPALMRSVDEAIADWLRHEAPRAMHRLLLQGPMALRRAVEIYYSGGVSEEVRQAQRHRHDRELVDAWAHLLSRLAQEYPQAYLAEVDAGRVRMSGTRPTMEIRILGRLDLPGAVAVLLRYQGHADWLVRYHVVAGLGWRSDAEAAEATQAAVLDEERLVRDEAARWLQRRDPQAAAEYYQRVRADPALPAALRPELSRRVATAKRLATVRQRGVEAQS